MPKGLAPRAARAGALSCLAVAVLAAFVAAPASALPRGVPRPFPVCIQMGGQAGPDIAGSLVVWTDGRNGNLDIYGRDLRRARDIPICTDDAQQDNPSVTRYVTPDGKTRSIAVWVEHRAHVSDGGGDIYGRDLARRREFVVARGAGLRWYPEIIDHWVVWIEADLPGGPYRVRARDLDAGTTYLVATSRVLSPVAVGRRTVGAETVYTAVYASGQGDISARDLPGGDPVRVAQTDRFEWWPDISGDRVVWWEEGGRVMTRDLTAGRTSFVHLGSRPRVDGEFVVWDGGGSGGSFTIDYVPGAKVYVRDLARGGRVTAIGQSHLTCLFPAVSGRRVVWESGPAKRVLSHIHIYGAWVR